MKINLLHTKNLNISEQLKLEEDLLKKTLASWCIINEGSKKTIVMGSSNKKKDFLNIDLIKKDKIPIISRFTSGGTVIVDENTIFISFIFSKKLLNFSFPENLYNWTENLYKKVFNMSNFSLKENDFTIGNFKCGGNAQYIKKERWLHHTSFLWDFDIKNMDYLLIPQKTPNYRKKREHKDFLCKLKNHFFSKNDFLEKLKKELKKNFILKK